MKDDVDAVYDLAKSAALARFRILGVEGEEHSDRSWQRATCHIHREDLPWGAIPIIYALAPLSFGDGRPRGPSGPDHGEKDEWRIADMVPRLRFERGGLGFVADYVAGRVAKPS